MPTRSIPTRQPLPRASQLRYAAVVLLGTGLLVLVLVMFFRGTKPRYGATLTDQGLTSKATEIVESWSWGLPDAPEPTAPPPKPAPPVDAEARQGLQRLKKSLDDRDAQMQKTLEELRKELRERQQRPAETQAKTPPKRVRAVPVSVVNAAKPPEHPGEPLYTLGVWEYLPCVLENLLNSEIEGLFTVKLTRPVLDVTRTQVLIPQGQRVGAKSATADLLFGNERIPTFALSARMPDGSALDLGEAPIMDAAGTNGLTGEVDNHVWRLVWTSIFIGGLRGGQQVLQQEIAGGGPGAMANGIMAHGSSVTQQRLGRAQDTRPTMTVQSGDLCNILIPKALQLPSYQVVQR